MVVTNKLILILIILLLFTLPLTAEVIEEDDLEDPLVYISEVKITRTVIVRMDTEIGINIPVVFEIGNKDCKWLYGYAGSNVYIKKINKNTVKFISPDEEECMGFLKGDR